MKQLNIFELTRPKYKITKPIRLVENFAGIGSQAKALKNIGANFEHHRAIEYDKYAMDSYNAIHGTNFEPLDITKITAKDLGIVETDKYDYIMTYSFPCQDLSPAGKGAGMKKGSGTRSGLLWEVERLLKECNELPQILLMENVPQVIGKKNIQDFQNWQLFLEKLGYSSYFKLLNAKDYEIPQNRNRCFMVSILGDYYYEFPHKRKLKLKLKDMLEDEVDEKYYLSDKMIAHLMDMTDRNGFVRGERFNPHTLDSKYAYSITTNTGRRATDNFIILPEKTKKGYAVAHIGGGVYINRPHQKRGVVQKDMIQTLKTSGNDVGVVVAKKEFGRMGEQAVETLRTNQVEHGNTINPFNKTVDKSETSPTLTTRPEGFKTAILVITTNLRIRKLTPKECWRLMGFSDEDFEKARKVNSDTQLYKQAGNSIVVKVLERIFEEFILT